MPNTHFPENGDNSHVEAELIERIYKIAIRPQAYDDFMDQWASYVSSALADLTTLEREYSSTADLQTPQVQRHFEMGFRLLEELGRQDAPSADASTKGGAAACLVNRTGQIVWHNGAAGRLFDLRRGSHVSDLTMWEKSRGALGGMIARLSPTAEVSHHKAVLRVHSEAADRTVFLVADIVDRTDEAVVLLREVQADWHDTVGEMLTQSFGLSQAELQIAECLVEGADIPSIAQRRSSSVNTVRTQVKTLMSKTGVSSQTELVRLLLSLNAVDDLRHRSSSHVNQGQTSQFLQRDGRVMTYHRFGPEMGQPVVFFHGMLDGCDFAPKAIQLLFEHRITVYAIERPHFGSNPGDGGPKETAHQRLASDVEDLLNFLDLKQVTLFGHMGGSVYAFAAAAHLGERVQAIVSVSGGVPIVSARQIASMAPRQKLVAYTARYTPNLLPFVLRAGIRQLDFGGEEKFIRALYASSPHDINMISKSDVLEIIAAGYHFSVAQGYEAFEVDSFHVLSDWRASVSASTVPVFLLHGQDDPVVSVASVREFAAWLGPRASLNVVPDSGQLLLYQAPETVVSTLKQAVSQPARLRTH